MLSLQRCSLDPQGSCSCPEPRTGLAGRSTPLAGLGCPPRSAVRGGPAPRLRRPPRRPVEPCLRAWLRTGHGGSRGCPWPPSSAGGLAAARRSPAGLAPVPAAPPPAAVPPRPADRATVAVFPGKESRGVPGTPLQERGAGERGMGPPPLRPGAPRGRPRDRRRQPAGRYWRRPRVGSASTFRGQRGEDPEVFPVSTGSSPAPSNGGGAPVATGAAMPVWLREYSWRQTGSAVYLSLPLRGVRVTPANIFCTDQYLKVGRPRSAASLVSRAFCRAVSLP